jgi:hypothetical protein
MAKARKMATFLALMRDKVEGVVQSATTVEGVDPERVREVSVSVFIFASTLDSDPSTFNRL